MKETQSFEGEQGGTISPHLALGTMGNLHRVQRNQEDLCLANNFLQQRPFSRLLKIEQKRTIASLIFPQISTKRFPLSSQATTNFKFRVW